MTVGGRPERIEPYEILEELGRGGFGIVYLAQRSDQMRRKVALKVLHPGMASPEVLTRFRIERETLQLMSHPGIASLLDAGTTDDGRPFVVMEYVRGSSLPVYADERRLGLRARLELFLGVCDAVQHAHQKGVIHRDLSAGNVMVTEIDGRPVPKVIDFGIAKPLAGALAGDANQTMPGQAIGTPEYMSPEQAEGRVHEVDTRTDVYSLGVQLYELVTGHLPFESEELRGLGSLAMERLIVTKDPPLPSVCVETRGISGIEDLGAVRARVRALRGDLDWVVQKAMAKERDRRYASVAELAEDVRRFLRHEAVLAGPPGARYRLARFVRRHRAAVAGASAVVLALLVGLVATAVLYVESQRAAEAAETSQQVAESRGRQAAASAEAARASLAEYRRLSDLIRVADLESRAAALWPVAPESLPALSQWSAEATELADRLDEHRAALSALADRVAEADSTGRDLDRERFLASTTGELVDGIESLIAPEGTVTSIARRAEWAAQIERVTVVQHREEWRAAAAAVAADRRFGADFRLEPQLGLVPIGADPRSSLQEFVLLQDASPDQVPERDEDGVLKLTADTGLILVLLPPALDFTVGAQRSDPGGPRYDADAQPRESPESVPAIPAFFISKFEMTQAQWRRHTGRDDGFLRQSLGYGDGRHPIEDVSWVQCVEVCQQLGLELPSETQWEYACRAGRDTPWWFGSDRGSADRFANLMDRAAIEHGEAWAVDRDTVLEDGFWAHAPVGTFDANDFGLHDTCGNVHEWCSDVYRDRATGEVRAEDRAIRGGSYSSTPASARSAARWHAHRSENASTDIGLRPVRAVR